MMLPKLPPIDPGLTDTAAEDLGATIKARTLVGGLALPPPLPPDHLAALPHISLAVSAPQSAGMPYPTPPANADLQVTGILGEGGMGRVILARQRSLQRDVAVKVLNPDLADPFLRLALLDEAVTTGSLEHPGIVPVHALGRDDDGRPVLVMKRIEGVSWQTLLDDHSHPGWARFEAGGSDRIAAHVEILMAVCNALHFAHERGVIHRDIKPANVMIGAFGEVYLVDWGIAAVRGTATAGVTLVGTPASLAPEMVYGDPRRVDARTDVYLLGTALHAALTGRFRHEGTTLQEMIDAALESRPYVYGPEVPAELAALCNQATDPDPDRRPPSALAFRRSLAEYLRHRGSIALSEAASEQLAGLRALLAADRATTHRDPAAAGRISRTMTECRFGYTQALRQWAENPAALAGLGACLEAMIDQALAREDREGAAQLLAELPEPRPDLEQRIVALDTAIADRRERQAALARLERDQDISVGARPRAIGLGLLALVNVFLVSMVQLLGPSNITARVMVIFSTTVLIFLVTGVAILHRLLLATQIGRIGMGGIAAWAIAMLGHRITGAALGIPVAFILVGDLWITATTMGFFGLNLWRPLWWGAAACVAAALAASCVPGRSLAAFCVATFTCCGLGVAFGYRSIRK